MWYIQYIIYMSTHQHSSLSWGSLWSFRNTRSYASSLIANIKNSFHKKSWKTERERVEMKESEETNRPQNTIYMLYLVSHAQSEEHVNVFIIIIIMFCSYFSSNTLFQTLAPKLQCLLLTYADIKLIIEYCLNMILNMNDDKCVMLMLSVILHVFKRHPCRQHARVQNKVRESTVQWESEKVKTPPTKTHEICTVYTDIELHSWHDCKSHVWRIYTRCSFHESRPLT